MAQTFARMTIKLRWWVKPYFWALWLFVACFGWAMDEGDLHAWLDHEIDWITKQGLICKLEQ